MAIPPVKVEFQATGIEEIVELVGQYVLANRDLSASLDATSVSMENEASWAQRLSEAKKRIAAEEQRAARAVDEFDEGVRRHTQHLTSAERQTGSLQRALEQSIAGWGTLGTSIGQVGAVLGRVSPEFGRAGAALGQMGQTVSSVVTALAAPSPASITSALVSVAATIADGITAFASYSREADATANRIRNLSNQARAAVASVDDLTTRMRAASSRAAQASRLGLGVGSAEEQEAFVVEAEKRRRRVAADLDLVEQRQRRVIAEQGGLTRRQREAIDAEREALERRGAALDAEIDRRRTLARESRDTENAIIIDDTGDAADADRNRGGGGGLDARIAEAQRRADTALRRGLEREQAFLAAFKEQLIERQLAEQEAATEVAQVRADIQRTLNEIDASNLERTKANARRRIEILEDEADRTAEVRRTAIERQRQLAELNEGGQFIPQSQVDRLLADYDRIEARRQQLTQALIAARSVEEADAVQRQIRANEREVDAAEFRQSQLERLTEEARARSEEIEATSAGILQPVLSGITSAIADVISGARSAEEAFQALLSSFLQSIAERAAVEAAAEYAAAIGAFARYDYASGGQHLAAGVAWTGVAIAAGVGAAVTAPAEASATAPADPGGFGGGNGDGGGTVVVNFSGPVVTASTEAELGDNINRLIGQSNARAA